MTASGPDAGPLRVAVPRGILHAPCVELFARAGLPVDRLRAVGRELTVAEDDGSVEYVLMRPSDVPVYVEYGAADVGVCGKDVLAEQERRIVELLDLRVGPCRLVWAVLAGSDASDQALRHLGTLRIATKYPRIAARFFAERGLAPEVIELGGSIELAPLVGLAEGIVDLVATGRTLADNGLVVREHILASTARLVANRVALRLRADRIAALTAALRGAVGAGPP